MTEINDQSEQTGELIAGKNPVVEALRAGRDMNKVWLAEGIQKSGVTEIIQLARDAGIIVQFVPKKKLDNLTDANHQGIVASVAAYRYAELDDLFDLAASKQEDPLFIILDEIEDPHNLGSIMRTADAVGAHGIIIPKRRSPAVPKIQIVPKIMFLSIGTVVISGPVTISPVIAE